MGELKENEWDYGLGPGESFEPLDDEDLPIDLTEPHVMTVLGPVDPAALGFTLHHEHLVCRPPGELADQDLILDDIASAASELEGYFATGGRSIVDMTTAEYGRNASDLLWIAQRVPVHIVTATGLQDLTVQAGLGSLESLADEMISDLSTGIDRTGVRAGVICASASEATLRSAALVHRKTGSPISFTSSSGQRALEHLSLLLEEGVAPSSISIGFDENALGQPIVRESLERGIFFSFRRWAISDRQLDDCRLTLIADLVREGLGNRILISGGIARKSNWLSYGGGPGFVHFIDLLPIQLMEAGLSAPEVRRIFFENPADALTIRKPTG